MPLPSNKSDLLKKLNDSFRKLDAEFAILTKTAARKSDLEGKVSPCDILAYQIGWGQLLLGWEKAERAGKIPDMPAKGYKWNELGRLAESFYKERKTNSLEELRADFERTVGEIVDMIEALPTADLFKPKMRKWTGEKWAMVKWIQINTIAPYSAARTKVRRWKKES
ncbi:MAG: ClbS/DfsB family four-helix bundle protein [Bdellovibrionaceae bacterium]|nr:ClbS/DfsB family four-helix bundle protein [Pseudobdellovibrionaceae bacterium]